MPLKRLFLLVLVLIFIIICFLSLYVYKAKNTEKQEKAQIFEIKNTQLVYSPPESKVVNIGKHYMIINPPQNLQNLKTLIEKFQKDNPIDNKIGLQVNKERVYTLYFYRESYKLPRNWQPNDGYFTVDRIEDHRNDCIATIIWSDSDYKKNYCIMEKSNNKYGSIIETQNYIDNQIITN